MYQTKLNTAFKFKYLQLHPEFGKIPSPHQSVESWSQLIRFLAHSGVWFKNKKQKYDERSKEQSEYPTTMRIFKESWKGFYILILTGLKFRLLHDLCIK